MAVLSSTLRLSLLDQVSAPVRKVSAVLGGLQRQQTAMLGPLRSMTAQVLAVGGAYVGVTAGMSGTYQAAADAQAALTEIGIKAGLSNEALAIMQQRLTALSPTTNQFTSALTEGVNVMLGMGLSADNAMGSIGAVGKAATATGATMADLSTATVAAIQNLKVAPGEISRMLDGMASAGNAGAFELKEMAAYFPSLGAAYQGLGQKGVSAVNDLAAALQIVRQGAGDSASAAGNLENVLQKINAPQTRKAFQKMGVNLGKEMEKASAKGMTPIEAIAEVTNKTLKGDLGKLGDLFADSEVQKGLRPLIQSMGEYRKIREEANQAAGTIADAYSRRMNDANEKTKALKVSFSNLGTAIGANLLGPIGQVSDYLTNVLNTADSRVTVFDRMRFAIEGFANGFGPTGLGGMAKDLRDFIFGVEDGSAAADQAGRIFKKFREWGQDIKGFSDAISDNPIGRFFADIAPYGLKAFGIGLGITFLVGTIRKLAAALFLLSGASTLLAALKTVKSLSEIVTGGGGRKGGKPGPVAPSSPGRDKANAGPGLTSLLWGSLGLFNLTSSIPSDPKELTDFMAANKERWGGYNSWLEKTVGSPKTWLGTGGSYAAPVGVSSQRAMDIARANREAGYGGTSFAGNPGKQADNLGISTTRLDASSIAAMTAPSGTQDVRVTNPQPPVVNVTVNQTVNEAANATATATAFLAGVGATVKDAVQVSYAD